MVLILTVAARLQSGKDKLKILRLVVQEGSDDFLTSDFAESIEYPANSNIEGYSASRRRLALRRLQILKVSTDDWWQKSLQAGIKELRLWLEWLNLFKIRNENETKSRYTWVALIVEHNRDHVVERVDGPGDDLSPSIEDEASSAQDLEANLQTLL